MCATITFEGVIREKVSETGIPNYDKERFIRYIVSRQKKASYKIPESIVRMYGHYVLESAMYKDKCGDNLYLRHFQVMPSKSLEDYYEIIRIYGRSF